MSRVIGSNRSAAAAAGNTRAQAERAARQFQPATAAVPHAPATAGQHAPAGWFDRLRARLQGDDAAAYGVSLLVHLVILAIFAIPVIRQATQKDPLIAAIVEESPGGGSPFGLPDMINTELAPVLPQAKAPAQLVVPDLPADDTLAVSKALLGTPDGKGGQGTGAGSGIGAGDIGHGMMQFVPKNAVRAGSFAAWTTPVYDDYYPRPFGAPEPKPGDSPQPMQNYWITIQLKVPGERLKYSVKDLTGEVVGTDGYRQKIPQRTFQLTQDGKLRPLTESGQVPVIDGVVQLVVRVPGARSLVKDTIVVKSKLLKEEQALEIIFKGESRRDVEEDL